MVTGNGPLVARCSLLDATTYTETRIALLIPATGRARLFLCLHRFMESR